MTALLFLSLSTDMAAAAATYGSLITGSVHLTLSIVLVFGVMPRKPALHNYRVARYATGGACLFLSVMRLAGFRAAPAVEMAAVVLQAYLFTFATVMLLDMQASVLRRILPELIPAVALAAGIFAAVTYLSRELFLDIFWLVAACYVGILVYFACLFRKYFLQYLARMDNFYPDEQRKLMYWTCILFAAAVLAGCLRFFTALFVDAAVWTFILATAEIFLYTAFATRLVDYAWAFNTIEPALTLFEIHHPENGER